MTTTRDALVEAAAALVDEGGPAAVTLREVGRRAGVSHNAPYKHFTGKEDLLAAVAARDLERQARVIRDDVGHLPGGEAVRAMLRGYVRAALRQPRLFKLTYGPWSHDSAELGAAATAARGAFVAAVERAQLDGALPPGDAERLASLLLALAHGAVDLQLAGHLARDGKGRADAADLVDDLLAHLAPPP
jgi:AcrR family transcriptional regulator